LDVYVNRCSACKLMGMFVAQTFWQKALRACIWYLVPVVVALTIFSRVEAQDIPAPDTQAVDDLHEQDKFERLQSIGTLIKTKKLQRDELIAALEGSAPTAMQDERERLRTVIQDLASLRTSFESALLPNVDTQLMANEKNSTFNWRGELLMVIEPLLSSVKSMTERPRQMTELREHIELDTKKLSIAEQALLTIQKVSAHPLNDGAAARLQATRERWIDARNLVNESLQISRVQLGRLQTDEDSSADGLLTGLKGFLTGRGLTLALAILAGASGSVLMKLCWHVINTRLVKKSTRRKAMWYRLLAYSYHLSTLVVVIVVVMYVLYLRQDVLLMGLAFLAVAAAMISLRTFLPRFLTEIRLLLNMGAVREDECVVHEGLPWQVMSLNMFTILSNPALEGIIRLPLNVMTSRVSRPVVKNELWFPTQQHDYIILPDKTFGQVLSQTPDLVKLSVKGGMSMSIPTAEFYAMKVMNLSSDDTFSITATFCLDYSLREMSLNVIPELLKLGVLCRLKNSGFQPGKDIISVQVEFKKAGISSLEFHILTSVNSSRAVDYFSLERLIQQACVAVANKHQWVIPLPQLTLHHQSTAKELAHTYPLAA